MLNKVILIGRVGKDPEVRRLESGATIAKTSFVTSETYKDKDGNKQEESQWHNLVLWKGLAEIAEKYVKKGSLLYVEGKITYGEYEKDGQKKYFTEIVVSNFKMLGGGNSNGIGESKPEREPEAATASVSDGDPLPF